MTHAPYPADVPERGFHYLGDEVRRGKQFPREEVEAAIARYFELAKHGTTTGDWNPWADLFTDDAIYVEHSFGVLRGREAIRQWVTTVTHSVPSDLDIVGQWYLIENDVCAVYTPNRRPAPDGGEPYQFIGFSVFIYAGDGMWCYEEDLTNTGEIQRVSGAHANAVRASRQQQ